MFAVETIMLLDYVIIYLYKEYKNVLMARGLGVREGGGGCRKQSHVYIL